MADEVPKLYTKKTFAIAFSAVLIGASLGIYREYRDTGSVSKVTIGASVVALLIGVIIIVVIGRYANKPEK